MSNTVALHTLGCKLNFSETTALGRMLEQAGYTQTSFEERADVYVINTCSVTENADKECRMLVRRIQKKTPEAMVVITGCYAQLKPEEIASIPGVDLVLGAGEKFNLVNHLRNLQKTDSAKICSCDIDDVNIFVPSYSKQERTRVFLKVQDGCDYNCSFCTIPLARGKSRSDSIANVMENVKEVVNAGAKEIVLTGINLGDFGKGLQGGKKREETFFELMQKMEDEAQIQRIRISSIEPNLLTNEMIAFVAESEKFMPHFHIPLQSGSNRILANMRRRYRCELYAERVQHIKNLMPHACIGVDVIVGFPGETDDDFMESVHFLESLDISYLHVFTYSERANTDAPLIDKAVPMYVRHERNKILRQLSHAKQTHFERSFAGTVRKVLFEGKNKHGAMEGYSDNYIRVSAMHNPDLENTVVDWKLN